MSTRPERHPIPAGCRWLSGVLAVVTVVATGLTAFGGFLTGPAAMVGSARGTAIVLLLVTTPTLVAAMAMAARGSLRAVMVWLGSLAAILYNAQMLLYGTPFNNLFLLYTAMLGLSVWSIGALVRGDLVSRVGAAVDDRMPVRWIATYVWVVAGLNAAIWLRSIVPAVLSAGPASVLVGTGLTTNPVYVQDLALWLPLAIVAAGWLWRRRPAGSVVVGGLLVMWVIESISIAVDQWMGSQADPGSVVASSAMALAFGLLAVVGLLPLIVHLRHVTSADRDLARPPRFDDLSTGRTACPESPSRVLGAHGRTGRTGWPRFDGTSALRTATPVEECSQQVLDKEVCSMSEFDSQNPQSTTTDVRRVRRSRQDRVIGGVCGGLAQYLRVDPVLLRIAAVALALSGGVGLLAYVIAWIIIPEASGPEPAPSERVETRHGLSVVVGAALVALGGLLLLNQLIPWFSAAIFWPIVVVVVGVLVLTSARR